jgi:hypothetical protein
MKKFNIVDFCRKIDDDGPIMPDKTEDYEDFDKQEYKALQIRFPVNLYNQIQDRAKKEHRSFNGEVIYCLEKFLASDASQKMSADDMKDFLTHLLYPQSLP